MMLTARRRRLKRKTPFIICCLLLIALVAGGYQFLKNRFFLPEIGSIGEQPGPVTIEQRLNVLLLGIDARNGETHTRTDTIILASVDPKSKQMTLLSIPRDTRVNIPKHGWDKINSATVYGGVDTVMKVVSDLLGIPVKYYVLVDFSGFKNIVDALGGVTLEVEQDMYHYDPDDGGAYTIDLKKGLQRLDGDKALQYVRYRGYAMGDIDRTAHQQKFLVALAKEMMQPGTILKLPALVPEINKYVKTNLSLSDMMTLAQAGKKMEDGTIVAQTLPGRPIDINGGSYWGVEPEEARQMVANLFKGETVTNVVLSTPMSNLPAGYGTPSSSGAADQTGLADEDEEASTSSEQASDATRPQQDWINHRNDQPEDEPDDREDPDAPDLSGTVIITPGGETGDDEEDNSGETDSGNDDTRTDTGTRPGNYYDSDGEGGFNPGIPGVSNS